MTLTMYQADRNFVTPANDASLYSALADDVNGILNRGNKLSVSVNGLIATVQTGQALIQGRLIEVVTPESVSLPQNSSGKICVTVDLTKTNDVIGSAGTPDYSVKVNQVYITTVIGDMTQDDLNNGGLVYQMPIASFVSATTSATVTTIKSTFSDTGWVSMQLGNGATTNGGTGYAEYRVKNNLMMISFYNINCKNAANGNQIVVIPQSLQPVGDRNRYYGISNMNINSGYAFPATGVVQSQGHGAVLYALWDYGTYPNLTGATGTVIYPIN